MAQLYDKACKDKIRGTCYDLGFLYYVGAGVKQDYKKAKEYLKKACNLGDKQGCDAQKELTKQGY